MQGNANSAIDYTSHNVYFATLYIDTGDD